jgi:DNA (cytosine-5)-methyltransferase 1
LVEAAQRLDWAVDVRLAVESKDDIAAVYRANFGIDPMIAGGDVAQVFSGDIGERLTPTEQLAKRAAGDVDVLVAGPPCQGHSNLNNHTRRDDPKNALYVRTARAAEVLDPDVVIVENVPPVQWDKNDAVGITTKALTQLGYSVNGDVVNLSVVGVPQRRRRYLLLASKLKSFEPDAVFVDLDREWGEHGPRSVRWAIGDLEDLPTDGSGPTVDTAPVPQDENRKRIEWLFEHDEYVLDDSQRPACHRDKKHSYRSVYGRLAWEEPAQTITTGFGSMGQGRYVHPSKHRTITPHEAARLQSFPDWFDWGETKRTALATMIGNAVPPLLTTAIGLKIIHALTADRPPNV